jgi:predicted metalloenzyme YecM
MAALAADGITVDAYELDHICYRVATPERYRELRDQLAPYGELLTDNPVNGRPIATFRLATPLRYQERRIHYLELPAPKPGSPYAEGWEHVEFVVDVPLPAFAERYPHVDFDRKGLTKTSNADLRRQYPCGSVKFHRQSLAAVIARERG